MSAFNTRNEPPTASLQGPHVAQCPDQDRHQRAVSAIAASGSTAAGSAWWEGNHVNTNERRWFEGHLRVLAHDTIEVAVPQGLAPASYPLRVLNRSTASNLAAIDVQAPGTPVMRTEDDRLIGEPQHWVAHQGNVAGFAF